MQRKNVQSNNKNHFDCINNGPFFIQPFLYCAKLTKYRQKRDKDKKLRTEIECRATINSAPLFDFSTNLLRRQID